MKEILRKALLVVVFIVSLALIFNSQISDYLMTSRTNDYIVSKVSKNKLKENNSEKGSFDFSAVKAVKSDEVFKSQINRKDLPVIGGIAIPDLKMNLPIFKGTTNENFLFGAGTMKENQKMGQGNYSLASHHVFSLPNAEKMLFSPLVNAKKGMIVYITDKDQIYSYKIYETFIVTPDHVEVLDDIPNRKTLTLITCTDAEATQRTIVRGELVKVEKYSEASKKVSKSFSEPYNAMQ